MEDFKVWRCTVCGWLHEGENPPANCPRCGAPAEKFVLVDPAELDLEDDAEAAATVVKELTEEDKKRIQPALFKITYGLYIVGSISGDKLNAQTCNTVFQITSAPMRVAIGINKNNLTNEYIKESGVFSVCILGQDHIDMVRNFGFRSGRDVDKLSKVDYTTGVTGVPVIDKCIAYVECRVDENLSIDVGTHTLFVGEVVEGNITSEQVPMTYEYYRQNKNAPSKPAPEVKKDVKQWRCKVCDYIHEGETPPDECPVCGAPREEFELVE